MKDTVHRDYLKSLEPKLSLPELRWDERCVMIVGSDKTNNIGAATATNIACLGASVIEYDKGDCSSIDNMDWSDSTDLVVACASVQLDWIEDLTDSDILRVIWDSLISPIQYISEFARTHMDSNVRKHIVLVGSMAHSRVLNASAPYCAAKAGLAHFARCAAWELTPKGFTVAVVHPGNVEGTPMTDATIEGIMGYRNLTWDEAEAYWSSTKLTEKWLKPQDVAKEIVHLLEASPHHSGCQIDLPGGMR